MSRQKGTKNNDKQDKLEEYFKKIVVKEDGDSNTQHDHNEVKGDSDSSSTD
jgi:hypothetical protein